MIEFALYVCKGMISNVCAISTPKLHMWHETKKQSKAVSKMMADMRKKSESRSQYIKSLSVDKLSLLQINGKQFTRFIPDSSKHILDNQFLVPWSGDQRILIDRYDARALLDRCSIPEKKERIIKNDHFEYLLNYERYRYLILLESLGFSEEGVLKSMYSSLRVPKRKKFQPKTAAIGYTYKEAEIVPVRDEDECDASEEIRNKLEMKINLENFTESQKARIDEMASQYGVMNNSFLSTIYQEQKDTINDNTFDIFSHFKYMDKIKTKSNHETTSSYTNYSDDDSSPSRVNEKPKFEYITEFSSDIAKKKVTDKSDHINYAYHQSDIDKTDKSLHKIKQNSSVSKHSSSRLDNSSMKKMSLREKLKLKTQNLIESQIEREVYAKKK